MAIKLASFRSHAFHGHYLVVNYSLAEFTPLMVVTRGMMFDNISRPSTSNSGGDSQPNHPVTVVVL
jgi:hypothetical protein